MSTEATESNKALVRRLMEEVFNLGNPEEVTINELARRIIELTGARVGIDHIPYSQAYEEGFEDMERRVPDITKVRTFTGYAPRYSLDDALRLTRDWFVAEKILEETSTFQYGLGQLEGVARRASSGKNSE
jgi:nucleoside-diphosphate-sugar epimerase